MQNIEMKTELRDLAIARMQCRMLNATRVGEFVQRDTCFHLNDGRLKRRVTRGLPVEWIYYHRPDRSRACLCNYSILTEDEARRRWNPEDLIPWVSVAKVRELWLLDSVRIHLDRINGLGNYIEFEARISRQFDVEACHRKLDILRRSFLMVTGELISVSYSDLLALRQGLPPAA